MTAPVTAVATVSKFKGIHDLAYVFTRFGAAGNSGSQQDWIGFTANLGGAAGKTTWYLKDKFPKFEALLKKAEGPTPTYIVDLGMVAVAAIDLLNGFGAPTKGESLGTGKEQLENVNLHLRLALPDKDKWSGDSAETYRDKVTALQRLVESMKELDTKMQDTLKSQAGEVQNAHTICAVTGLSLVAAQGIALLLYFLPGDGPGISFFWQVTVVAAALLAVSIGQIKAGGSSVRNNTRLQQLAREYDSIAESARNAMLSGTFAQIALPGAQESTVESFEAISTEMSGPSDMPTIRSLAGLARGSAAGDEHAPLGALTTHGETPRETPETPVWAPPTLVPETAMSGQFATLSGHLSQHPDPVNQTMGPRPQIASTTRQSQGAAAPAKQAAAEEATLAGHVEDAGASAGTEGPERAPIEVAATRAEESQQPSPVERIA
jgi:hypothetical protein